MNTETAANPADEMVTLADARETITSQQGADNASTDLDDLAREALGETPPDANPEFIEVEIDGKKLKVMAADGAPVDPELKFGALRDSDYRKKTMALADERKTLQQEREILQARANLEGEASLRATNLASLDAQVRQLAQVNVAELQQAGWTNEQIEQAKSELREMAAQRDQLVRQVSADIQQMRQFDTGQFQQAREAAIQQAGLEDKALTPERIDALESFAIQSGISEADAKSITDPVAYKLLHLAEVGSRFLERQRTAANFRATAAGSPSPTLAGASAGGKSPETMSFEEFSAWREAGNG